MWTIVNDRGEFFHHFSCSISGLFEDEPGIPCVTWGDERYAHWWQTKRAAQRAGLKAARRALSLRVALVGVDAKGEFVSEVIGWRALDEHCK